MLLAPPPLKGYFLKLVDVLSSINQRLRENKGKEAARSTFSPGPQTLFIRSSLACRGSSADY